MPTAKPAEMVDVIVEVEIKAPPEKVWKELTEGIGAWWPAEFYGGGEAGKRSYHMELNPGGRMYESWDGGGGLLWGHVVLVDPGKKLQVLGSSFPEWGGPSQWFGTWDISANADGSTLRFSESTIGKVGSGYADEKEKGWIYLFGGVLKAHVEGKPIPEWVD